MVFLSWKLSFADARSVGVCWATIAYRIIVYYSIVYDNIVYHIIA